MKNLPDISVVMSCYNGAEWIGESIQSVLEQTYSNFEFIIVNDGSTDDSLSVINDFAMRDERIVVINKKNTGLSDSLNVGLKHAKSEWIARIDCDDVCIPSRLEKQLALAKSDHSFVFVGSAFYIIDETGQIIKEYQCPTNHEKLKNNLYNAGFFPPHSSAFFKVDAIKKVGGYRVRIKRAQDWDLWLRLSDIGKLTGVQEPLVKIRKHSTQVSNEDNGKRQVIDCTIGTVSSLIRHMGGKDPVESDDNTFEKFRAWIIQELKDKQYFDFYEYLDRVRLVKAEHGFIATVIALLSKPLFLVRFVRRKTKSDNMFRRIALQWLGK